jgi:protein TonB
METLLKTSFCDSVSENRNKSFGQYELRTRYADRMFTSLTWVLSSLSILTFGILLFSPELKADKFVQDIPDERTVTQVLTIHEKAALEKTRPEKKTQPPPPPPRTESAPKSLGKNLPMEVAKQTDEKIDSMPTPEPAVSASSPDKSGLPGGIPGGVSNIVTPTNPGEGPGLAEGDPKITDFPEIDPEFSGNLESFLSKSTKYPPKAVEEGVEGQVFVCFIIDENGKVTKPEVLKGIGFGCDEEALRVIKSLPDWKPGKMNGHPVKVRMRVPFKFRLK